MKNIYKHAAKIYSFHHRDGHTTHCLFYNGRVLRSWIEDEHGYSDDDWAHRGYESDPWKGNTRRNLDSSGFDMWYPKDTAIWMGDDGVEYRFDNLDDVWREVGGTKTFPVGTVNAWGGLNPPLW